MAHRHHAPRGVGAGVGGRVGAVRVGLREVLHAAGDPVLVEQHPRDEAAGAHLEQVRAAGGHVAQALAGAGAPALPHRQRDLPQALRQRPHPPVVRVDEAGQALERRQRAAEQVGQPAAGGRQQDVADLGVAEREPGVGERRGQPAVEAVPRPVDEGVPDHGQRGEQVGEPARARQHAGAPPVVARLQPLEPRSHRRGAPARVAGERGDAVPVAGVGVHRDHRVVGGAAADGGGPRVEHAAALLGHRLVVAPLPGVVVVVAHVQRPAHPRVLAGPAVEGGHRVVGAVIGLDAAVEPGLEHEHPHARLGEVGRHGPTARPRPDDDVVDDLDVGVGGHDRRPGQVGRDGEDRVERRDRDDRTGHPAAAVQRHGGRRVAGVDEHAARDGAVELGPAQPHEVGADEDGADPEQPQPVDRGRVVLARGVAEPADEDLGREKPQRPVDDADDAQRGARDLRGARRPRARPGTRPCTQHSDPLRPRRAPSRTGRDGPCRSAGPPSAPAAHSAPPVAPWQGRTADPVAGVPGRDGTTGTRPARRRALGPGPQRAGGRA